MRRRYTLIEQMLRGRECAQSALLGIVRCIGMRKLCDPPRSILREEQCLPGDVQNLAEFVVERLFRID